MIIIMLNIIDSIPKDFLPVPLGRLYEVLPHPTLLQIEGNKKQPLFVAILLHGDEDTGLLAIQSLLSKYRNLVLPRSLIIFIGNVEAARYRKRHLDHQIDFNRIWETGSTQEHALAKQVTDIARTSAPFACIDIHNNTGLNPHYAATNSLDNRTLQLASLFNRTVIYFTSPEGTLTSAMGDFCPSTIIECGQTKRSYRTEAAVDFIEECMHMTHIPDKPVAKHDIDLFQPKAVVKVPTKDSFCFGDGGKNICFIERLEHYNFSELNPGTVLAKIKPGYSAHLEAWDNDGNDVGSKYFLVKDNEIRLKTTVMPSMLTMNHESIRKDCLCYFMERRSY